MTALTIDKLKSILTPLFEKQGVLKAVVFGSFARKTESRKSDLDLMIIVETNKRFFERYESFNEIFDLIRGPAIDMLIYTPEEFNNISHRVFIQRILKEGSTIYEH
jgi:predicted nucleotidyltransferase